jgi:hypothetical protein
MQLRVVWVVLVTLASGSLTFAQDHSEHPISTEEVTAPEHIFCPMMKTGQLCSHGTAANLGLSGEKQEQWMALARNYNQTVNAATEQLFREAELILGPEKVTLLKAWFAVGLNPEINEILYGKGLYGQADETSGPSREQ